MIKPHAPLDPTGPRIAPRRWRTLLLLALTLQVAVAAGSADDVPADPIADRVRDGNAARRQGRIDDAVAAYTEASRLAPERYDIRILLAETLRRAGRVAVAASEFEAAVGLDPRRPEGYAGQAAIRRAEFDHGGAAALLETAIDKVPPAARVDLLLGLGETRRRQGRFADAERLFGQVLGARPGDPPAIAGLAQIAEARGDLDAALADWDRYLARKPDDGAASLRRQELSELRAAIGALREAASRSPGAALEVELGRLLAVSGDAAGAAAAYGRALAIDPEVREARLGLAEALRERGDRRGAAVQFRKLLESRAGDPVALYNLIALLREEGNLKAEESAWWALLGARPDDLFAARSFVAFLQRAGGEALDRAIDRLSREDGVVPFAGGPSVGAGDAAPEDPSTGRLRLRALLLAAAGRWDEVADALDGALRRDPTDPWSQEVASDAFLIHPDLLGALYHKASGAPAPGETGAGPDAGPAASRRIYLARLAWWSGRQGEVLILLRQAVSAEPGSALAHSALAEGYQAIAGNPALALEEMKRAVDLDPSRPAAHIDLALGLLRGGRAKEAEAAARRALRIDGDSAPARSLLGAALADQGDLEGAAAAYAAALRSDPADNFGLARGQHALSLAGLGREIEARHALLGDFPPIPEALYAEAWRFAGDSFQDRRYNGQDWPAWRDRYRGRLGSPQEAYRAIAEMLAALGDPYTRLRDPEETVALFLTRHAERVAIDPLGHARPYSKTVVARDLPGGLGYIRLSNLTDPAVVAEVRKALESMRRKEGIILDLRGNGGGFARSADAIDDLLAGPGKEAGIDLGPEGLEPQITGGDGAITSSPLVVLVDGQTASAAERLARGLERTGRGTLLGDTTYGKGRAQVSRVLPGGATVLVTTSQMFGPDGRPLQGRGLRPRARRGEQAPAGGSAAPREGSDDDAVERGREILKDHGPPSPP